MDIILPMGWVELSSTDAPTMFSYQKTYPDGLDVLLTIEAQHDVFELWSAAEHRCSGPAKNMDSVHQDIASAQKAALDEMVAWDSA